MSEYETHMIELVKQMAEDIRWLRQRQEARDRLERRSDEELLKLIEQTHRGPKKPQVPFSAAEATSTPRLFSSLRRSTLERES